MNDYNSNYPQHKANSKRIQLMLSGLVDSPNQDDSQCLETQGPCVSPRILKVVEIGDFWAKRTMPSIRLQGKWMLRAGVLPNRHVQVTNPSPGILMIQLLEDFNETAQTGYQITNPNPPKNQSTIRSQNE
jgi:hypothetical protein